MMATQRSRPSRHNSSLCKWLQVCSYTPLILFAASQVIYHHFGGNVVMTAEASSAAASVSAASSPQKMLQHRHVGVDLKTPSLFLSGKSKYLQREAFLPPLVRSIRGGASDEADSESESDSEYDVSSDDEYDESESEEVDDEAQSEESDSDDEYDDEEEEPSDSSSVASYSKEPDADDEEYDALLTPPAMQQFTVSIGVMLISNRIDIFDERVVRIARFAFLAYIISAQVFLIYVRLRAKQLNDRTPITISNPFASLVQGRAMGGENSIVKSLADQVLSTQTTKLEYDLKEVKKANGALLFPMVFLYFLHFRMKQVQPLIMQTATGFLNLVYSPLFQVYVLGRNLERPFRPPVNPMMGAMQNDAQGKEDGETENADIASENGNVDDADGTNVSEVDEDEENDEEDDCEYDSDEE